MISFFAISMTFSVGCRRNAKPLLEALREIITAAKAKVLPDVADIAVCRFQKKFCFAVAALQHVFDGANLIKTFKLANKAVSV